MPLEGHLLALVLVLLDLAARTVRIRWLLGMVHAPLPWRDAACLNAWSDLAAAITPMRLGGEPARLATLRAFKVPMRPALGALGLELAIATPATLVVGITLVALFGREWLTTTAALAVGWLGGVLGACALIMVAAGWAWRRRRPPSSTPVAPRPPATGGAVLVVVMATLVSVVSRIAIVPALLIHTTTPEALGPMLLGSFALLFGQVLVPVPAGAGAIDAAFLAGVAGPAGVATLVAWRGYTVGFGAVLGALLLAWRGLSLRTLLPSGRLGLPLRQPRRAVVSKQFVEDRPPAPAKRRGVGPMGEPPA